MPPRGSYLNWPGVLALVSVVLLPTALLHSQVRREIPSTPSCPACSLSVRKVATLGERDGPGAFATRPYSIGQDSRGRFYVVTPETSDEPPFVFDARGRYLQRLGRVGDGPGEFRSPEVVRLVHDTIYVFDNNGRITVLSPSYRLVSTINGPRHPMDAVRFSDGTIAVNALVRDRDRIGYTQHYLDIRGNYRGFADLDSLTFNPQNTTARRRRFAVDEDDRLWSAPLAHRYRLSAWNSHGQMMKELTRSPEWFQPYKQTWNVSPTLAPMPFIMGLWEDGDGYLWVVARVADPRWRRGLGRATEMEGQTIYQVLDTQDVYDAIIEVIDPLTARLVASVRLPETIDVVIRPGLVAGVRETEDGAVVVEVFRVGLTSP